MTAMARPEALDVSGRSMRLPRWTHTAPGRVGIGMVGFVLAVALVGPLLAPHSPDTTIGLPGAGPSSAALLGTDFIGRDVLSRLLHGGLSVIYLSMSAALLAYAIGIAIGLIAGFTRSLADPILMRIVDLVLSFPALILLLVLLAGAGDSLPVMVIGIAVVLFPGIARLVRTVTLEASVSGYVEAALANGERMPAILAREIFPNIVQYVVTDFGLRFSYAIILVASVNFLGLGLQPPAADWGLMIAENRSVISINIWAVLAPVIMLGLLTIGVNLIADAYGRTLSRSDPQA